MLWCSVYPSTKWHMYYSDCCVLMTSDNIKARAFFLSLSLVKWKMSTIVTSSRGANWLCLRTTARCKSPKWWKQRMGISCAIKNTNTRFLTKNQTRLTNPTQLFPRQYNIINRLFINGSTSATFATSQRLSFLNETFPKMYCVSTQFDIFIFSQAQETNDYFWKP